MGKSARRRILCACCGQEGTYGGHGWRTTCYSRWRTAGYPEGGPPPPQDPGAHTPAATAASREAMRVRKERRKARALKLHRHGGTTEQIARRLGVTERTVQRYLAETKTEGGAMPNYEDDSHSGLPWRYDGQGPVGTDFANRRDLSGTVEDLLPERWERVIDHVRAFARDDAERAVFLDMLGLAGHVTEVAA